MTPLKYPILGNAEWLKEKYVNEQKSTTEIAELIGCTKDGVRVALIRHKIPLRNGREAFYAKKEQTGYGSFKYPLLNDKQWLQRKHFEERWSLIKIAEFVGAKNPASIGQAFRRHGLSPKDFRLARQEKDDGFIFKEDVLTGCLLGDASLKRSNRKSTESYAAFSKKNKFKDHVEYVFGLILSKEFSSRVKEERRTMNGKVLTYYKMTTSCHKTLQELDDKWYPSWNNYKKVVPADIVINEAVLLHWFLDDGSTSWRKRARNDSVILTFCSESFEKKDQEMLCEKVNEKFDLRMKLTPYSEGSGWRIKIPESQVNKFFDVIGPCPAEVPSMRYKWKLRAN